MNPDSIGIILPSIFNRPPSSGDDGEKIVKEIKMLLSFSHLRFIGFLTLEKSISNLDDHLFTSNVLFWLQNLFSILQEDSSPESERLLYYKVLSQILMKIYQLNIPNLNREINIYVAPLLVKLFTKSNFTESSFSTHVICICATLFPAALSSNFPAIEAKIMEVVAEVSSMRNCEELLKLLGFCYAKISLVGSPLDRKWRKIISQMINTLYEFAQQPVFASIEKPRRVFTFDNCPKLKKFSFESDLYETSSEKSDTKLYFITSTLSTAITGQYSAKLPLPIEGILECLNTLNVIATFRSNDKKPKKMNPQEQRITTCSTIIENVFDILKALLISCKSNILSYCSIINHIIYSAIEWFNDNYQSHKASRHNVDKALCNIYQFLSSYFQALGPNTCLSNIVFNQILDSVLKDLKANDLIIEVSNQNSNNSNNSCDLIDTKNLACQSTLCLNSILNHGFSLLERSSCQKIQNEVIHTLLYIYRNWFRLKTPYNNDDYRLELLKTLRFLVLNGQNSEIVALEAILALYNEAERLENSKNILNFINDAKQLINFVLLSRIPIKNDATVNDSSGENESSQDSPSLSSDSSKNYQEVDDPFTMSSDEFQLSFHDGNGESKSQVKLGDKTAYLTTRNKMNVSSSRTNDISENQKTYQEQEEGSSIEGKDKNIEIIEIDDSESVSHTPTKNQNAEIIEISDSESVSHTPSKDKNAEIIENITLNDTVNASDNNNIDGDDKIEDVLNLFVAE